MIIATHNGTFHADEITACIIFKIIDPNAQIIRSRDEAELEKADYVIDVSGKYDLEKHFDHHPKDFTLSRDNGIKYATAGLIWEKFGGELLKKLIAENPSVGEISDKIIANTIALVDKKVMQYTDITDNGQLDGFTASLCNCQNDGEQAVYERLNQFYMNIPVSPYIIAMQNVRNGTPEEQDIAFINTINALLPLYKNIFFNTLLTCRDEEKVIKAYDGSEILWLNEKLPWFDAVMNNWDVFTNCKIAIYPDHKNGWRIQSLPGSLASRFVNRCGAPLSWRGKEFAELNALAGTSTASFVHKTGFTGGADTKEDIIVMAKNWILGSDK